MMNVSKQGKTVRNISYSLFLFIVFIGNSYADTFVLPLVEEVESIWLEPQEDESNKFYTADSLLEALPFLRKASFKSLGFGKVWLWQRGVIHLKNGKQLKWRAFTKNIILFEPETGPVFYTDINSESHNVKDGKITRTINTREGTKKIVIDMNELY